MTNAAKYHVLWRRIDMVPMHNMNKIMMVEPLADGGIAHYAYNLATALARKLDTILYTSRNFEFRSVGGDVDIRPVMFRIASRIIEKYPALARETFWCSLLRRSIKLAEYPFNALESITVAKKERVDVVHFQTVNMIELIMIALFRLANIRVVYTVHNVLPRHQRMKYYHPFLYRWLYALCTRIIIHSFQGKDEIVRLFKVDPQKVSVIPHGDYKFFLSEHARSAADAKRAIGIHPNTKTILCFGAIRPNKGLENALLALPLIRRKVSDVKLLIVGEVCENYGKYHAIVNEHRLESHVYERLEYIQNEDVASYFQAADIVVLPYNEITQSGVLQIAYAFGKPVVASKIGGFVEAVLDGKNGYLVPINDRAALAEKIITIISDDSKIEEMGKYSRYLSDTEYSWSAISERTIRVYEEALR